MAPFSHGPNDAEDDDNDDENEDDDANLLVAQTVRDTVETNRHRDRNMKLSTAHCSSCP